MVTVNDYAIRTNSENGEDFVVLILTSDLEMVQSKETGRFYATTKKCSVSSTFDKETAKRMIGKQMPGSIIRQECESYDYVLESGEILELSHNWVYSPEESTTGTVQLQTTNLQPVQPQVEFSTNGQVAQAA